MMLCSNRLGSLGKSSQPGLPIVESTQREDAGACTATAVASGQPGSMVTIFFAVKTGTSPGAAAGDCANAACVASRQIATAERMTDLGTGAS
jgi:hypothetical protein